MGNCDLWVSRVNEWKSALADKISTGVSAQFVFIRRPPYLLFLFFSNKIISDKQKREKMYEKFEQRKYAGALKDEICVIQKMKTIW